MRLYKFARKFAWRDDEKRQRFYLTCGQGKQITVFGDQCIGTAVARQFQKHLIVGILAALLGVTLFLATQPGQLI